MLTPLCDLRCPNECVAPVNVWVFLGCGFGFCEVFLVNEVLVPDEVLHCYHWKDTDSSTAIIGKILRKPVAVTI